MPEDDKDDDDGCSDDCNGGSGEKCVMK